MPELLARRPSSFNSYYEPFLGGGALFFEQSSSLSRAYLSDTNIELIIAYQVIRDSPEELISTLRRHAEKNSEEYFYSLRQQEPSDPVELAAWLIYMNKTGYNGLFRVNRRNGFNVPYGRNPNANIAQPENIRACSAALSRAHIRYGSYKDIAPSSEDFVYFDPPYHPTTETSFVRYSSSGFTERDQQELADFATKLHRKGVKVMLSNSDTPFIRDIYRASHFNIASVEAPRAVNCKPEGRGGAAEVIVTTYA